MRRLIRRSKASGPAAKSPSARRTRRPAWLRSRRLLAIAAIIVLSAGAISGSLFELYRGGRVETVLLHIEDRAVNLSARLGTPLDGVGIQASHCAFSTIQPTRSGKEMPR